MPNNLFKSILEFFHRHCSKLGKTNHSVKMLRCRFFLYYLYYMFMCLLLCILSVKKIFTITHTLLFVNRGFNYLYIFLSEFFTISNLKLLYFFNFYFYFVYFNFITKNMNCCIQDKITIWIQVLIIVLKQQNNILLHKSKCRDYEWTAKLLIVCFIHTRVQHQTSSSLCIVQLSSNIFIYSYYSSMHIAAFGFLKIFGIYTR